MIHRPLPESLILIPQAMNPVLNVNKQTKQYLTELNYLKQKQVHMPYVQLCRPLGVNNPLATSHTFEEFEVKIHIVRVITNHSFYF